MNRDQNKVKVIANYTCSYKNTLEERADNYLTNSFENTDLIVIYIYSYEKADPSELW